MINGDAFSFLCHNVTNIVSLTRLGATLCACFMLTNFRILRSCTIEPLVDVEKIHLTSVHYADLE